MLFNFKGDGSFSNTVLVSFVHLIFMSLSLVTLNVRGLRFNVKCKALFLFAKQQKSDFCFFQEVHSTPKDVNFWKAQWGNDVWFAHGSEHTAGVAILKNKFSGDILFSEGDPLGHFIILVIKLDLVTIIIVNFYGYNSKIENDALFKTLESRITHFISKFPNSFVLIGGDFNITLDNSLDRWPPRSVNYHNSTLKTFMQKFSVVDIWRDKFPGIRSFTWNDKACTVMSRIDYWLTPCNLHKENISVNILPTPLTDHKAVSITISLLSSPSSNYHNSYWKLNKSLLEHEFVKMTIRSLIAQYCNIAQISNNYYTNWELFKFEACKFLRKFGSLLSKARKFEEEMIISKITSFTHKSPNLSDNEYLELFTLQSQLDDIYKRRAEGAFIRSRQRWLEKGEQNSAFFFQLEKNHAKANKIVHLNINGTITSDSKDIADYCSTFFSTLYNSGFNEDNSSVFIDSLTNSKTINEDQKEHCDSSICIKEVLQAITELKLNKSPGIDGLNSEFYNTFSEELAPFLLKLFLQSIEYGKLPPTLTQGLIS